MDALIQSGIDGIPALNDNDKGFNPLINKSSLAISSTLSAQSEDHRDGTTMCLILLMQTRNKSI